MKRVLLTGGSLGRELVSRLPAAGYSVGLMSRRSAGPGQKSDIEWAQADLKNGVGLAEAVDAHKS